MKKNGLNLLPEHARFDITKHLLVKRLSIILLFNIIVLILISFNLMLKKNFLKSKITEEEIQLKKISSLVENFITFKEKYSKLLKQLNILNQKKEVYYKSYSTEYSPFLSIMILGESLTNGIEITTLTYVNGQFLIKGIASSSEKFYDFYKTLNKNKFIKQVDFHYLKKNNSENFDFNLTVLLKELK